MGYGYGHSSSSWLFLLLPVALIAFRALASGRRRGAPPRRPQAPPSFFVGHPSPPASAPTSSPPSPTASTTGTPAGWFTDPFVKHEQRYWSGTEWTEHILDDGVPGNDPPPSSTRGAP
ncbi:MAG: DUF2510 domain-containing protein [Acidimicrobiales bacterium]